MAHAVQKLSALGSPDAVEILGWFLEGSLSGGVPALAHVRRAAEGMLADEDLEFFELHEQADIEHSDAGWRAVERFARKLRMENAVVAACERNLRVWEHYLSGIAAAGDKLKG